MREHNAFSKIWLIVILLLIIACVIFIGGIFLPYEAKLASWVFSLIILYYAYSSFVLMTLARKTKTGPTWIAWIPIINFYLLSKIARMHWWPFLLFVYGFGIFLLSDTRIIHLEPGSPLAILIAGLTLPAILIFFIFVIIWIWKTFERMERPGWWTLLGFIPVVGPILLWILLGVAARGNPSQQKETL